MTRLANIEKAGYFRLPPSVTERLVTHIAAPKDGRLLDPCAGEGAALVALAERLHLEPFGVELHEGRAKVAREAVDQLLVSRHVLIKGMRPQHAVRAFSTTATSAWSPRAVVTICSILTRLMIMTMKTED